MTGDERAIQPVGQTQTRPAERIQRAEVFATLGLVAVLVSSVGG